LDELYEPSAIPVVELKRLENRRRLAWLAFRFDSEPVAHSAAELFELVSGLRKNGVLGEPYAEELLYIEADLLHLKGRISLKNSENMGAREFFEQAVSLCTDMDWDAARSDLKRTISDVHALLATNDALGLSKDSRRDHALRAAQINGPALTASTFSELLRLMTNETSVPILRKYLDLTLGASTHGVRTSLIASVFSRNIPVASRFLLELANVTMLLSRDKQELNETVLQRLANIADLVILQVYRRRGLYLRTKPLEVVEAYENLLNAMLEANFEWPRSPDVDQALDFFKTQRTLPPHARR
jgi:hypothetical protein